VIKSVLERTVKSIGHLAKEELKSTVEEYKVKELVKKPKVQKNLKAFLQK